MGDKLHVGDTSPLNIILKDRNYNIINVSEATSLILVLKRPDGCRLTKTLIKTTNGSDGKVYINFEETDLNQEGQYYYQAWINWADGKIRHSDIVDFEVYSNL